MLLESNTQNVINLLEKYEILDNVGKIRLAIYLVENKQFDTSYNTDKIIEVFKNVLSMLDNTNKNTIINFAKYKHLLFLSAKYLELTEIEKKIFFSWNVI